MFIVRVHFETCQGGAMHQQQELTESVIWQAIAGIEAGQSQWQIVDVIGVSHHTIS